MSMSSQEETYELYNFDSWVRVDLIRSILEYSGAKYDYIVPNDWPATQAEQKFGKVPRLTIKGTDGSIKHLWEASSIEYYLAEKYNLLPTSLFEKAESLSIVSSLFSLRDEILVTVNLPTELRGEKHKKHIEVTVPGLLIWHEKLLEESMGKFYAGDKVSLPDLALVTVYLRCQALYADDNPINATSFPRIMKVVDTLLAGKVGEYVRERREGAFVWDNKEYKWRRKYGGIPINELGQTESDDTKLPI